MSDCHSQPVEGGFGKHNRIDAGISQRIAERSEVERPIQRGAVTAQSSAWFAAPRRVCSSVLLGGVRCRGRGVLVIWSEDRVQSSGFRVQSSGFHLSARDPSGEISILFSISEDRTRNPELGTLNLK